MPYQQERSAVEFTAPLFIREGVYREDHMLPYLESEGWKGWASEDACLINWFDMRQGLFMLYKNFDDLFVMDDEDVSLCVNILEEMEVYYATRQLHGSGLYEVLVGYGFDISRESLPRVKEFFNDSIVIAADGAKYPWSGMEKNKKFFFPNGFSDPLYEDGDDWINDPDEYPESTSYTGGNS